MPTSIVTFPTWQELYGRRPEVDEVNRILHGMDRLQTALLLSQISIHLALDRFQNETKQAQQLQGFLVSNLIPDDLFLKLKGRYAHERLDLRRCFHPWQVLTLLKLVITECQPTGGLDPDRDGQARHDLGRALVMTNDLLMTKNGQKAIARSRVSEKRRIIALQLQLGSASEINNPPSIKTSIVRTEIMFGEIAGRVAALPLDIKSIFAARRGLQLESYIDFVFGILTYYLTQSQQELIDDSSKVLLDPNTFFRMAPQGDVQRFFEMEMTDLDGSARLLRQPSLLKPQHDFIAFRRKPLLQLAPKSAICPNPGFLEEKLESGIFWSIFNSFATDKERWALFQCWGKIVEEYVHYLLTEPLEAKAEQYIRLPAFEDNGDEAFDGIVTSGDFWFVIECKGGFLKADAKYAEDEDALIDDLRMKFGTDSRAGVGQLARKIGQVFCSKERERRTLHRLDSAKVKVVVPIMVVQESFVSSPLISTYLAGEFRSAMRKQQPLSSVSVGSLQILDVADLETIRPYLRSRQCTFRECLMERVRMGDKAPEFRAVFGRYFRQRKMTTEIDSDFAARSRVIFNRIAIRFFGRPYQDAPE